MLRVGGFQEFSPKEQVIFDDIVAIIEATYQQYGYAHIETPAVERNEVLLKGGEESSKQVFGLYGMAQGADDLKGYGLRFDLTVPFTRYVLDRVGQLTFPFKRYQVQPVWRGERSQKGRFKQFYQADIDVLWRYSENRSYAYYDAETLFLVNKALSRIRKKYLPGNKRAMHVNNRRISTGFFSRLTDENETLIQSLYKLLDDYYKITSDVFEQRLIDMGLSDIQQQLVLDFAASPLDELDERFGDNPLYTQGVKELQEVFGLFGQLNHDNDVTFVYDPYIVRGLDYYTGTVFETFDRENIKRGSLGSGGRYEKLAQSLNPKAERFDGVGGSIGASRLASLIMDLTKEQEQTSTIDYLFVHFAETQQQTLSLMQQFAQEGKTVEYYPEPIKLGKQFAHADKKRIRHVVILGEGELEKQHYIIKNMETGESQEIALLNP